MDNDRLRLAKKALESGSYDKDTIEYIFPELKESEDEKIRKALIKYFTLSDDNADYQCCGVHCKDIVAWLERQGEHKHVVPKFRVGDKIKKGYLTYTVEDIGEDSYKLQAYSKDGDKGCTEFLTIGYEKDYELVESKPIEWSEEDKKMLEKVIANIECPPCTTANYKPIREMVDWLKFLKDRVQPQPKQEWSKNDEIALADALWCCKQAASIAKDENDMGNIWFAENWLNSLSPQNRWKPTEEQMKAIMYAKKGLPDTEVGNYKGCVLEELYEQLKAL